MTIKRKELATLIGLRYFDPKLVAMAVLSPAGDVLDVNEKLCTLFGYTRSEFADANLFALLHGDDDSESQQLARQLSTSAAGQVDDQQRWYDKSGTVVPVCSAVQTVAGGEDSPEQLIVTLAERSDATALSEQYQASERRNQLLLHASAEAVVAIDGDGRCSFCNPVGARLLGYPNEQALLGLRFNDLFYRDEAKVAENKGQSGDLCADCRTCPVMTGQRCEYVEELEFERAGDVPFFAEFRCHPQYESGGKTGAVATFIDITRRKNLQMQSVRASQLAALGELSAGIAHEINNPVSGVINYAQILRQRHGDQEPVAELTERILKEGERIAAIVKNMLFFAGNRVGKRVLTTPTEIVEYTAKLIHLQLERDAIELEVDVPGTLPPLRVNFQEIEQLFINIISNACYALNEKYPDPHRDKRIEINARSIEYEGQGYVRTEFFDRGTGIPAAVLDRIMTPFMTTKPAGIGTGLGLSLGQDIVKRHAGRIMIDSHEGEWTRVLIDLPVPVESDPPHKESSFDG